MHKHIFYISTLVLLQFLSAIAFVPAMAHILQVWYHHGNGWWQAIQAEYAVGGWIMVVEIAVILGAIVFTLVFEIRLIRSFRKADKALKAQLDRIENNRDMQTAINNLVAEIREDREERKRNAQL